MLATAQGTKNTALSEPKENGGVPENSGFR
jgi:hypothetical protein